MTAFRLISLPLHAALELAVGLALMLAPFAGGFGLAGTVTLAAVGALVVGLALAAATTEHGSFDITAHHAYDVGVSVGLLGAALVLALGGDLAAGLTSLAAAVALLALNLTTRYSVRA